MKVIEGKKSLVIYERGKCVIIDEDKNVLSGKKLVDKIDEKYIYINGEKYPSSYMCDYYTVCPVCNKIISGYVEDRSRIVLYTYCEHIKNIGVITEVNKLELESEGEVDIYNGKLIFEFEEE